MEDIGQLTLYVPRSWTAILVRDIFEINSSLGCAHVSATSDVDNAYGSRRTSLAGCKHGRQKVLGEDPMSKIICLPFRLVTVRC
jgi:hypothetical protein